MARPCRAQRHGEILAHTETGTVTITKADRRLTLSVPKELKLTCDFEADVTWVLGLSARNAFRVTERAAPARLVVDVQQ